MSVETFLLDKAKRDYKAGHSHQLVNTDPVAYDKPLVAPKLWGNQLLSVMMVEFDQVDHAKQHDQFLERTDIVLLHKQEVNFEDKTWHSRTGYVFVDTKQVSAESLDHLATNGNSYQRESAKTEQFRRRNKDVIDKISSHHA